MAQQKEPIKKPKQGSTDTKPDMGAVKCEGAAQVRIVSSDGHVRTLPRSARLRDGREVIGDAD